MIVKKHWIEKKNLEKKPSSNSGSSNVLEYDYGITFKLTEYVPISGGNILELNKYLIYF